MTKKTFERGEQVEILRESWMSQVRFEPATYQEANDRVTRERYHWVVLPDDAEPMYVVNGMVFDEPGPGRVETRRLLIPSRRIRKTRKRRDPMLTEMVELIADKRVLGCLARAGVRYAGDLTTKTERELLKIRGWGRRTIQEVREVLEEIGLRLASEYPDDQ